jgi:hypothetical protein
MSTQPLVAGVITLLAVVLLVPATFFIAPQPVRAQAIPGVPIMSGGPLDFIDTIKATLTQIDTFLIRVAEYAQYVNTYVLQPLAFVMSGQLMKALTQSVLKYVIGQANGTGIPQFTVDIQKSLRSISDFKAQAYFRQVSLTNSPFATSIAQALGVDYNQKTSLAGYWAANLCTLGKNIPNYNQNFLTGNWGNGGIAAWFQLTTQSQNNPYLLYQNSQAQLASVIGPGVGGATGARLNQLQWGQGFMSWCGATDTATQQQNGASTNYQACIAKCDSASGGYTAACADSCGSGYVQSGGIVAGGGVNPGDPCTKSDGTSGTIQTPGSTIKATLDKVLGGQQDKLVQIGNISTQVNSILNSVGTIFNTINLAANILGGGGTGSGGLLAAGQPSGSLSSFGAPTTVSDLQNGYGTTASQINQSASSSAVTAANNADADAAVSGVTSAGLSGNAGGAGSASDMQARVKKYSDAWNAVAAAATSAKASLQTEINTCHAYWNGGSTYENDAQNAISFEIVPVLTQAAGISTTTDAALAQYNLVKNEPTTSGTYQADLDKLNTMPPTASDVSSATFNATAYGGARANPAGSLTVSGSSIVDQMNLISSNAAAIQASACTTHDTGGGGA